MSDPEDARSPQLLRAVLQLREKLLAGEFPPGIRVAELTLAPLLGVSRTPLRLALGVLEHEGLLRTLPSGGFVVREFTASDIADAIELRGVLEGTASRLAAERWSGPDTLAPMRDAVAEMDTLTAAPDIDFAAYVAANERFHAALHALAASPMLNRALAQATALPFASPSAFVHAQAELAEHQRILVIAQDQHRCLLDAIAHREGSRAESLAREHARLARRNLDAALSNRAALEAVPGSALIRTTETKERRHARSA
jgi:GntR family transcriptional regulator of vanillate catabolism